MNRLLLSLCLVWAAFPGRSPTPLQINDNRASPEVLVETRAAAPTAGAEPVNVPAPNVESPSVAIPSTVTSRDNPQAMAPPAEDSKVRQSTVPLPPSEAELSTAETPEQKNEEPMWVAVSRAAWVHSGPSVSSPIIQFYGVGTELRLIGYSPGWFQIFDPETSEQGWIYERYYLEEIGGPNQRQAIAQTSQKPIRTALVAPKPKQPLRHVKKRPSQQVAKFQMRVRGRISGESVASLVEKAFRGY